MQKHTVADKQKNSCVLVGRILLSQLGSIWWGHSCDYSFSRWCFTLQSMSKMDKCVFVFSFCELAF